jgi:ABC-type transporter Mla MlaB component
MITVETEPTVVTLRLEGRLAGPEARELSRSWNRAAFKEPHQTLSFDLTGVSSVDMVGIEFLARAHREGDTLVGGAATSAIVDEIVSSSGSGLGLGQQRVGSGS